MNHSVEKSLIDDIIKTANIYPANSALPIIFQDILKIDFFDPCGAKLKIGKTYLSLYAKNNQLMVSKIRPRKEERKTIKIQTLRSGHYQEQSVLHNGIEKHQSVAMHLSMIAIMSDEKSKLNKVKNLLKHLKEQTDSEFLYEFDKKNMDLKSLLFSSYDKGLFNNLEGTSQKHDSVIEFIEDFHKKNNNFNLIAKIILKNELFCMKQRMHNNRLHIKNQGVCFLPK